MSSYELILYKERVFKLGTEVVQMWVLGSLFITFLYYKGSLAICGKQICFEIQTDIVSKYYPCISGNIFLQTCHLITKITL